MPESYSQYYTKNLLSFVATIQLIYILIFQKYPPFPAFVLPSNIGFQTHTRKNRPAVLTYIDPMIYVSSSPILHIGIWVDQKYRYSQYNFSFFQTNPVLSFLSADYPPFEVQAVLIKAQEYATARRSILKQFHFVAAMDECNISFRDYFIRF